MNIAFKTSWSATLVEYELVSEKSRQLRIQSTVTVIIYTIILDCEILQTRFNFGNREMNFRTAQSQEHVLLTTTVNHVPDLAICPRHVRKWIFRCALGKK